uniref:Titin n=1 Tax=Electrophorus electricus TaxID=8005 RepID=A0AAY5EU11_ELEEL
MLQALMPNICSHSLVIPEIRFSAEKTLTIKAGENIKLSCNISGRPVPQVTWYKDGKELDKMLVDITTVIGSSSLFIRDADRENRGVYTIEAKNSSGTKKEDVLTFTITVIVFGRPSPPSGPFEISGVTSESCVLTWSEPTDDGGTDITNYIVEKRESGQTSWQVVNSSVKRPTIKVTHLTKYMEYTFRVCAENKFGVSKPIESEAIVAEHPFSKWN